MYEKRQEIIPRDREREIGRKQHWLLCTDLLHWMHTVLKRSMPGRIYFLFLRSTVNVLLGLLLAVSGIWVLVSAIVDKENSLNQ